MNSQAYSSYNVAITHSNYAMDPIDIAFQNGFERDSSDDSSNESTPIASAGNSSTNGLSLDGNYQLELRTDGGNYDTTSSTSTNAAAFSSYSVPHQASLASYSPVSGSPSPANDSKHAPRTKGLERKSSKVSYLSHTSSGSLGPAKASNLSDTSDEGVGIGGNDSSSESSYESEVSEESTLPPLYEYSRDLEAAFAMSDRDDYASVLEVYRQFESVALLIGKIIIEEFNCPVHQKLIKPVSVGGVAGGEKFIAKGIIFKFVRDVQMGPDFWLYGGKKRNDKFAFKGANHELKGYQALSSSSRSLRLPVHFPLICRIDWLGMRLIALSLLPITGDSLIYGSKDAGSTIQAKFDVFNGYMERICGTINLEPHLIKGQTMHGPGDIEGHYGNNDKYYLLDFARVLPPQSFNRGTASELFYNLFRVEFLINYTQSKLNPDVFTRWNIGDPNGAQHELNTIAATKHLFVEVIPNFARTAFLKEKILRAMFMCHIASSQEYKSINDMNSMYETAIKKLGPIGLDEFVKSTQGFTEVDFSTVKVVLRNFVDRLHFAGINLRYLGAVLEHIPDGIEGTDNDKLWHDNDVPRAKAYSAWRMIVLTEMLARCLKNRIKKILRVTAENQIMTVPLAKDIIVGVLNTMVHNRKFWELTSKGSAKYMLLKQYKFKPKIGVNYVPNFFNLSELKDNYDLSFNVWGHMLYRRMEDLLGVTIEPEYLNDFCTPFYITRYWMTHQFDHQFISKLYPMSLRTIECKLVGSQLVRFYSICFEYQRLEKALFESTNYDVARASSEARPFNRYQRIIMAELSDAIAEVKFSLPYHSEVFVKEIQIAMLTFLSKESDLTTALDCLIEINPDDGALIGIKGEFHVVEKAVLGRLQVLADDCARVLGNTQKLPLSDADSARVHAYHGIALALLWRLPEALACFRRAVDLHAAEAQFMLVFLLQVVFRINLKDFKRVKIVSQMVGRVRMLMCLCLAICSSKNYAALSDDLKVHVHCILGNQFHDLTTQLHFFHSVVMARFYYTRVDLMFHPKKMNLLSVTGEQEVTKEWKKADYAQLMASNAAKHFETVLDLDPSMWTDYFIENSCYAGKTTGSYSIRSFLQFSKYSEKIRRLCVGNQFKGDCNFPTSVFWGYDPCLLSTEVAFMTSARTLPFERFLEDVLPTLPENWPDLLPKMNFLAVFENVRATFDYSVISPLSPLSKKSNFVTLVFQIFDKSQSDLFTEFLRHQVALTQLRLSIVYYANGLRVAISECDTLSELSLIYVASKCEHEGPFQVAPLFSSTRPNMRNLYVTFAESKTHFLFDADQVIHCPNLTTLYLNGLSRKQEQLKTGEQVSYTSAAGYIYPCTIRATYENGTYDVDFEDGEQEFGVASSFLSTATPADYMPRVFAACPRIESLSMLIADENYQCVADIAHHAVNLKSLALYGKMSNHRGLPAIELPERFTNSLVALATDAFDFYIDNDEDSYTFVRQCTNLTSLDIHQPRTVKVWNEQLLRFLPKLRTLKTVGMNPSAELAEEVQLKELPEPIASLNPPRLYPIQSIFANMIVLWLCDIGQSWAMSDAPLESLRHILRSCPNLLHLLLPERRLLKKCSKHTVWTDLFLEDSCVVKYVPNKSRGLLSLKLGNFTEIDPVGYRVIVNTQPNLTALSLVGNDVTQDTLDEVAKLTNLTCLAISHQTLRDVKIPTQSWVRFLSSLPYLQQTQDNNLFGANRMTTESHFIFRQLGHETAGNQYCNQLETYMEIGMRPAIKPHPVSYLMHRFWLFGLWAAELDQDIIFNLVLFLNLLREKEIIDSLSLVRNSSNWASLEPFLMAKHNELV